MKKFLAIIVLAFILAMCSAVAEDNDCLTVDNCEDLVTLINSKYRDGDLMTEFAEKYKGQLIEIDGFIYRVLDIMGLIQVKPGLREEASSGGAYFAFMYADPEDFGFEGSEFPEFIEYGNHVHIKGRIREYNEREFSIVLEPVSIELWNRLADGLDVTAYETLQKGDKGDAVKALQQRLIDLYYLEDKADGIYGNNTRKAVEQFQSAIKAEKNGIADPTTQAILFSEKAPERTLSISCSTMTIGSNSTTAWYVDGKEFTLKGNVINLSKINTASNSEGICWTYAFSLVAQSDLGARVSLLSPNVFASSGTSIVSLREMMCIASE